ncbi:MAG: FAD-dependent monooxygenase [Deltaproteobacteria bacterium]|nr:FAD-dependent monooxygenase [Deltaproteobacteria bacterium]
MNKNHKKIETKGIVVGAGLGGLMLALLGWQKHIPLTVLERSRYDENSGGRTLWLYPNALRILDQAGLLSDVIRHGFPVREIRYYDIDLKRSFTVRLSDFPEHSTYPVTGILRSDLHRILRQACPEDSIICDWQLRRVSARKGKVLAESADGRIREGAWLIGADGIHSAVRQSLDPNWNACFVGQICWQGTTQIELDPSWHGVTSEIMGRGRRFVFTEIRPGTVTWLALIRQETPAQGQGKWPLERLQHIYRLSGGPVQDILEHASEDSLHLISLRELSEARPWYHQNIALMGDAAHALTPETGQGAAQAFQDAWLLSELLSQSDSPPEELFRQYYTLRAPQIRFLQRQSRFIRGVSGAENRLLTKLRDTLLPLLPEHLMLRKMKQVYGSEQNITGGHHV